jgi:hypothetical protein
MIFEEYSLFFDRFVAKNLDPVGSERIPIGWVLGSKSCHIVGCRVELLNEKYGEIILYDIP